MVLLQLVELIDCILKLETLHCLDLFQSLFQLIDTLLRAIPFLTQLELIVTLVFLPPLHKALLLEFFDTDFLLQILQLFVESFNHLLATFKNLLGRVLFRLGPV